MIHAILNNAISLIRTNDLQVNTKKNDKDLVTNMDIAVSDYLIKTLKETYPGYQVISEENDDQSISDHYWIVDPIDGTANFVKQKAHFGMLCARVDFGSVTEAYIVDVDTLEIYSVLEGKGAYCNHHLLEKPKDIQLSDSLFICNGSSIVKHEGLINVLNESFGMRYYGACSLDGLAVIKGQACLSIGLLAESWDVAPMILFAKELGLRCCNFDGSNRSVTDKGPYVFGTPSAVSKALEYIQNDSTLLSLNSSN